MLLPKRVKYRRVHRGRMTGKATRGNFVSNGEFGIQALEPAWITSNPVSYTHLDVYKRQPLTLRPNLNCEKGNVTAAAAACMPLRGIFVGGNKSLP